MNNPSIKEREAQAQREHLQYSVQLAKLTKEYKDALEKIYLGQAPVKKIAKLEDCIEKLCVFYGMTVEELKSKNGKKESREQYLKYGISYILSELDLWTIAEIARHIDRSRNAVGIGVKIIKNVYQNKQENEELYKLLEEGRRYISEA